MLEFSKKVERQVSTRINTTTTISPRFKQKQMSKELKISSNKGLFFLLLVTSLTFHERMPISPRRSPSLALDTHRCRGYRMRSMIASLSP